MEHMGNIYFIYIYIIILYMYVNTRIYIYIYICIYDDEFLASKLSSRLQVGSDMPGRAVAGPSGQREGFPRNV